jgi:DNA repair exonuclease SbcCD ATPase subunit
METEQILECLLIEIVMQERADTNLKKTKTNQERLKAKTEASNKKFETLKEKMWTRQEERNTQIDALVSRMDACHEEMKACREAMEACVEMTEAAINAIRAELEGSIKHQVKEILTRDTGPPRRTPHDDGRNALDLQASLDTCPLNLHKEIADMRKDFHEELSLMVQVEFQATKALVKAT